MFHNYEDPDELNVEGLINALNDEENTSILELNTSKIKTIKNDLLQNLGLERDELKEFHKKFLGFFFKNFICFFGLITSSWSKYSTEKSSSSKAIFLSFAMLLKITSKSSP